MVTTRVLSGIRGVLYDLDETLIRSGRLNLASFIHVCRLFGISLMGVPEHVLYAMPIERAYKYMTGREDVSELCNEHRKFQEENLHLIKGEHKVTEMVIRLLHSSGISQGVVTSRSTLVGNILKIIGVREIFERKIVTVWDVDEPKPHPGPVKKGLELIDRLPAETFFVGDRGFDVEAAKAAGAWSVALDSGVCSEELRLAGPDVRITSLIQLVPLVLPSFRRTRSPSWRRVTMP